MSTPGYGVAMNNTTTKERVVRARIQEQGYLLIEERARREGVSVSEMVRRMLRYANAKMPAPRLTVTDEFQ